MIRKYARPSFLPRAVTQELYEKWLRRKAAAHVRRDRKRKNKTAIGLAYRTEIHRAVNASGGRDVYTGERLAWELIGTYDNEESMAGRRHYKAKFALLPTVDHLDDGSGVPRFEICSWRVNDAKNDLTHKEFVELCRKVLAHSRSVRHT